MSRPGEVASTRKGEWGWESGPRSLLGNLHVSLDQGSKVG